MTLISPAERKCVIYHHDHEWENSRNSNLHKAAAADVKEWVYVQPMPIPTTNKHSGFIFEAFKLYEDTEEAGSDVKTP